MTKLRTVVVPAIAVLIATVAWLVQLLQPPMNWQPTLRYFLIEPWAPIGFALSAVLLVGAAVLPRDKWMLARILISGCLNAAIGTVAALLGAPIYLDSIFTILMGCTFGPLAGMATGAFSNVLWGLLDPTSLPFTFSSILVGLISGILARVGGFHSDLTALISGSILGFVSATFAAPVAVLVYVYQEVAGTTALVAAFLHENHDVVGSVIMQCLLSDPFDKAISAYLAFLLIKHVPFVRRAFSCE